MANAPNLVDEVGVRVRGGIAALSALGIALFATCAAPAAAQYAPLAGLDDGQPSAQGPADRGRGDFVLVREEGQLLLLDSRTGCVWSRTPPAAGAPNAGATWQFEFPRGNEGACAGRLNTARTNAIRGNR